MMTALSPNNTSAHEDFSSAQIEAALLNFLDTLSSQHCSNATIRNYRSDIRQFYKHVELEDLKEIFSKPVLKEFVLAQKQKGLKDSSVTRKLASITQFALWSKQEGLISHDVSWMTQMTIESLLKSGSISIPNPPAPDKHPKPSFSALHDAGQAEEKKIEIKKGPSFLRLWNRKKTQNKKEIIPAKEQKTNKNNIIGKFSSKHKAKKRSIAQTANNFILPYLNLGLIILFFIGLGFLGYNQLVTETPTSLAYPSTPTRPNRVLSFQGRLTDTAQNPITTSTNMEFKIWSLLSGGTEGTCDGTDDCEYKTSTCSVTPDQDGIFNVGIGDDCGSEIDEAVFSENVSLWLEVSVGGETLAPRQPIRTVPFAVNSETVQGYPISASESATVNTLLVMDSGGFVKLGEDSPTLTSDTGTFTISGYDISLEATNDLFFSDARVSSLPLSLTDTEIDPALGQGIVDAINDVYNLSSSSSFFGQSENLIYPLEYWQDDVAIGGNSTASADILLSSNGNGIFTGSVAATRFEDQANSAYFLDPAATGYSLLTAGSIGVKTTTPNADLEIQSDSLGSDVLLLTALDGSRLGRFTETGGGAGWFEVDNASGVAAALFRGDGGASYVNGGSFGVGDTTPASLFTVGNGDLFQVDSTGSIVSIEGVAHSILDNSGDLELTSNSNLISLNDNVSIAGTTTLNSVEYTWPGGDGSTGSVLSTNGSGTLNWADNASVGPFDHLDHIIYPDHYWADVIAIGGNSTSSANTLLNPDGSAVFNAQGSDSDFQVEGQTTEYLIFGDASEDRVGIGTNTPTAKLHVYGSSSDAKIAVEETNGTSVLRDLLSLTNNGGVSQSLTDSNLSQTYQLRNNAGLFQIFDDTDSTARITVDGDGKVGIGDDSPDHFLDVAGNIGLDASSYINWGDTDGTAGYGFRDDSGTLQYKNSSGTWTNVGVATNTYWQLNSGSLSPLYLTTDINLGATSSNSAKISLAGSLDRGRSALIVNQTENQDVLSASASGNTLFTIQNNGNISFENDEYIQNNTDDLLVFAGSGGTTDTDLTVDLDGNNPVLYSAAGLGIEINDRLYIGTNNRYFYDEIGQLSFSDDFGVDGSLAIGTVNTTGNPGELITSGNIIIDNQGELRLREDSGNGTEYTGFVAPASLSTTVLYTLPDADGSVGSVLSTDSSGNLSWISNQSGDFWQLNDGVLSPASLTLGLNLGDTATNSAKVSIAGSLDRGQSALIVNQTENQDIFTASSSGTTRFTIDHNGNLDITGNIGLAAGNYVNWGSILGTAGYGFRDSGGTLQFKHDGGTWQDVGTGSGGSSGGSDSGYWDLSAGAISPYFPTTDVNIGDSATASAKVSIAGSLDRGKSALIINQSEDQDIFTASASGTTRLFLTNDGDLDVSGSGNFGSLSSINDYINLQSIENYTDIDTETSFTQYLSQTRTESAPSGNTYAYGSYNNLLYRINENSYDGRAYGSYDQIQTDGSYTYYNLVADYNVALSNSDAASGQDSLIGSLNDAYLNSNGNITDVFGSKNSAYNNSSGNITNATAVLGSASTNNGSATIDNAIGVHGDVYEDGGSITVGKAFNADCNDAATCYGLYIEGNDLDSTTGAYGIWGENGDWILDQDGGGSFGDTSFGGDIFFGEGQDAAIWYDGTDFKVNPRIEGAGDLYVVDGAIKTELGQFKSNVADGGSSVAYNFNTINELTADGALIADFQNQGTSLFSIDKDGNVWAKGNIYSDKGFGISMKNIGPALSQYDLVAINTTEDNTDGVPRMSATSSAFAKVGFGVVQEACTTSSTCKVVFQGETLINASNSISRGDYLYSSTSLGKAAGHTKQFDGMLGIATSTDDSAPYQVEMIFLHQPSVDKLRVADKNRMHADYREAAIDYTYANETNYYDIDENIRKGLYFDTFQDKIKVDSSNSDSLVDDVKQRAGLFGGITMDATNTDSSGNTFLESSDADSVYYYDRTGGSLSSAERRTAGVSSSGVKESEPQVLVELGIDPNWYNGVTLDASPSGSTTPNPTNNLSTSYNGSLIKVDGRYAASEEDGPIIITIKSDNEATDSANPSVTFDWATSYDSSTAEHSGSNITTSKGSTYTLETGTNDIEITFSHADYHAGDKFKIASWYLEPETANDRGKKQQFPARSYLITNTSSLDIIDADSNKLWMRLNHATGTWSTLSLFSAVSPKTIQMINGKIYTGGSFNGLLTIDLVADSANARLTSQAFGGRYAGDISERHDGKGFKLDLSDNEVIVGNEINDVHTAVIPNKPKQEVTLSGWGYMRINSADAAETVVFPYEFDEDPRLEISYIGYGVNPADPSDCTGLDGTNVSYMAKSVNNRYFVAQFDNDGVAWGPADACYSWTATGTISPKSVTAVGTDDGVSIIKNTNHEVANLLLDSQNGGDVDIDQVFLTTDGELYAATDQQTVNYLSSYYNAQNIYSESSWAQYLSGYYLVGSQSSGWATAGPTLRGSSGDISSLHVTENTSTIDNTSNTIYVGTDFGLNVLQEKQSHSYSAGDSFSERDGSVKYYASDFISEEMIGDIRGYWTLNGGFGSAQNDKSIKANDLTPYNITGDDATSGVRGTAFDFDGSTEFLYRGDDADFDGFTQQTVGAWVKPDTINGNQSIISKGHGTGVYQYMLYYKFDGHFSWYNNGGGSNYNPTSPNAYDPGEWHYVVGTFNSNGVRQLFVDGQLVDQTTNNTPGATVANATNLVVGSNYNGSGYNYYFDGTIDEVFMTAEVLTPKQIQRMYESGRRALQSHSINDYKNNLDEDGTGLGAYDNVTDVGVQLTSKNSGYGPYAYLSMEDGDGDDDGWINKIDLGSDTVVQSYTTSTDPNIPDNDVKRIAVSNAGLELVGMDGVGAYVPGLNSTSNNTTGTYYSDTIELPENINNAYAWINQYVDSDCSECSIKVYASNNGGSTWSQGSVTATDNNQSPPEKEYLFSFTSGGSQLKFRVDFTRDSNKESNVYIEKYGIAWFDDDDVLGGSTGGIFTNSAQTVANGEYIEVAHNQGTNDIFTEGWSYNDSSAQWESILGATSSAYTSQFTGGNLVKNYPSLENAKGHDGGSVQPEWWEVEDSNVTLVEASASAESVEGKHETILKIVNGAGGGDKYINQNFVISDEPTLTASNTKVSAGAWVRTPDSGTITMELYDVGGAASLGTTTTTTTGSWEYLKLENITIGTTSLDLRFRHSSNNATTYVANPQLNVGPKVMSWNERQLRYAPYESTTVIESALVLGGDPGTTWTTVDATGLSSNLTAKLDLTFGYDNTAVTNGYLFARRYGDDASGTGYTGYQIVTDNAWGGADFGFTTKEILSDDLQRFEYRTDQASNNVVNIYLTGYYEWDSGQSGIIEGSPFQVVQVDENTVRLYNYSGTTQQLRLDVATSGVGSQNGSVSLAPFAADVDAKSGTNSIWINKTDESGNLLKLQNDGVDRFAIDYGGNATLSGTLKLNGQLQLASYTANPTAMGTGAMYYDTTEDTAYIYNGSTWVELGAGGGGGSSYWTLNSGALTPIQTGYEINLGNTATDSAKISLAGANNRGKAAVIINQTEDQDIFTASSSGTTRLTISNNGDLIPGVDDAQDIGSNDFRWQDLFLGPDTLHIGSDLADEYTISYNDTTDTLGFNVNGSGNPEIAFDSLGRVGVGEATPSAQLDVSGKVKGQALVQLNELGNQDVFVASVSGNTRMRVDNDGYVHSQRFVDLANSAFFLDPAATGMSLNVAGDGSFGGGEVYFYDSNTYITGNGTNLSFKDSYLTAPIALSESGTTQLHAGFTTNSVVAAINELMNIALGDSTNISLNSFRQQSADDLLYQLFEDGIADEFEGLDAIDIAASDYLYNSTEDYFGRNNPPGQILHDTETEFDSGATQDNTVSSSDPYVTLDIRGPVTGNGEDGNITISSSTNINTDTIASGRVFADGIAYKVNGLSNNAALLNEIPSGLQEGDEVLLINVQGSYTNFSNTGNYEFLTIDTISDYNILFTTDLQENYGKTNNSDLSDQSVIIQRVPHYRDVTIASGGTLTAGDWDVMSATPSGTAGYQTGILAFRASGIVDVQSGGAINMDSKGYIGGTGYTTANTGGDGGEAFCGVGGLADGGDGAAGGGVGGDGYCGGGGGFSGDGSDASGGSGGGGSDRAAGGGGGYGTAGLGGGGSVNDGVDGGTNVSGDGGSGSSSDTGGGGGGTYGDAALSQLFMGSGAGGGGDAGTGDAGTGGDGGGIIFVAAEQLTVTGTISSAGEDGGNCTSNAGSGGGGAGGSVFIKADTTTLGTDLVTASGGTGGIACALSPGGGGTGGDGRIRIDANQTDSGTTSPTYYEGSLNTYNNYGILTSDELTTSNATSLDSIEWIEALAAYGEVQVMTRSGATADSTDGSWEEWKPITASNETVIDNMDAHTNWTGYTPITVERETETQFATALGAENIQESGGLDGKLEIKRYIDEGDGSDGDITISSSQNINSDTIAGGRSYADGIAYTVASIDNSALSLTTDDTPNGIAAGDEVLVMNARGSYLYSTNAGNYEFLTVASVSSNTITFESILTKIYGVGNNNDLTGQSVIIQRVPNYNDVTISSGGTLTAGDWDALATTPTGTAGYQTGIVAFRASGTVDVQSGGAINTDAKGYIGGTSIDDGSGGWGGEAFCGAGGAGADGDGGDGAAGGGTGSTSGGDGYCGGGGAAAGDGSDASGGSGGGGAERAAGGGAGYGTAGLGGGGVIANGGDGGTNVSGDGGGTSGIDTGGGGGGTFGDATLSQLFMGPGGGGGGSAGTGAGNKGGDGGGIIFVTANDLTVTGTISSTGETGSNCSGNGGSGGGGAGGSILIKADTATLGTSLISSSGGNGGIACYSSAAGDGGDGRIRIDANQTDSGDSAPSYYDGTSLNDYQSYGIFTSDELATTNAAIYDNIEWTEKLGNVGEIQLMTRSGSTANSTDGSWEEWKPVVGSTNLLTIDSADTHTDWTGTNMTVAEGDITRDVNLYEDEDEATATNLTKLTTTAQDGYAENNLGSPVDLSNYDYISFWIRSDSADKKYTFGMGEATGIEQEETFDITTVDTWQKVYWDISDIAGTAKDAIQYLRLTTSSAESPVIYLDKIEAGSFLTDYTGSQIASTADDYIQYRVIMSTTNTTDSPELENLTINYRTSQTDIVSAEGGVARDVDYYEDEDEATLTNMTKITADRYGQYIYRDLGGGSEVDLSSADYVSFWIYSSETGPNLWKISMGEATGTEQEELININTANTWQKVYWDISDINTTSRDAIRYFHLTYLGSNSVTAYMDDLSFNSYSTNNNGDIISSTPNDLIQYRVILTTTDNTVTPYISTMEIGYTNALGNVLDTQSEFDTGTDKFQASSSANPDVRLDFNRPDGGTGIDGSVTINSSTNINTDTINSDRHYADGIAYKVTGLSTDSIELSYNPNGIIAGDEILLINMQGDYTNFDNAGNYEFLKVASINGKTITTTSNLTKTYGVGGNSNLTGQSIIIQRVPQYNNVTIASGGTLTAGDWDSLTTIPAGITGYNTGIVAFRASGTVDVQSGGAIDLDAKGYTGGGYTDGGSNTGGDGGEAFCGIGGDGGDGTSGEDGAAGGGSGSSGTGGTGYCGGGGGSSGDGSDTSGGSGGGGSGRASGGGAGYGTAGTGGIGIATNGVDGSTNVSGDGGAGTAQDHGGGGGGTYGDAALSQLFMGSGGGGGGDGSGVPGAGGDGGGIIFMTANDLTVTGTISSAGEDGGSCTSNTGSGGGAAGGSILIQADSSTLGTDLITANGGGGGAGCYTTGGGAGGDGRIRIDTNTVVSGSTSPTYYEGQDTGYYYPYAIFTSDEINTGGASTYDGISWSETLGSYGEIQLMTRSGNTSDSTDGTWEEWKPVVDNTNVLNLNNANIHSDWIGYDPNSINIDTQAEFNVAGTVDFNTGTSATPSTALNIKYDDGDGADGDITISSSQNINSDTIAGGRSYADGIAYTVDASTATGTSLDTNDTPNGITAGDEVLLINMQGGNTDYADAGNYEFLEVTAVVSNTISFGSSIVNSYDGTSAANQSVIIQRVPNYNDVTISSGGTLTAGDWDTLATTPTGTTGYQTGIVAFRASGTVDIQSGGAINTDAKGYVGGAYNDLGNDGGDGGESFCGIGGAGTAASGGDGAAGGGSGGSGTGGTGYCGGGGGSSGDGSDTSGGSGGGGSGRASGGGAGYGTAGTGGIGNATNGVDGGTNVSGDGGSGSGVDHGGGGGGTYGDAALSQLFMGSAGGGGGDGSGVPGAGGDGGGIIFVTANDLTVTGTISSAGEDGGSCTGNTGSGGGAAGGSILIQADSSTLGTDLITANGGNGGAACYTAGGGDGGVGRIRIDSNQLLSGYTPDTSPTFYDGRSLEELQPYGIYTSNTLSTDQATIYERIKWIETVGANDDVNFMTRSGATADSRSGTWEEWKPVGTYSNSTIDSADTHTDWTGTNMTVAEGDVTRNVDYYEDEDETTATNLVKLSTSTQLSYADNDLGAGNEVDLSSVDYLSFWIRSDKTNSNYSFGIGESNPSEKTQTVTIEDENTWQKVYFDISDMTSAAKDAIRYLRLSYLDPDTGTVTTYLDNVEAHTFTEDSSGTDINSTPNNYIQYRAIITTTDTSATDTPPSIGAVTIDYDVTSSKFYSTEGDITRNVDLYEDEDETTNTNITKLNIPATTADNSFVETTISATDLTNYDYISFWIRTSSSGYETPMRVGIGENLGIEEEMDFVIETPYQWQKVYFDITDMSAAEKNAITKIRLTNLAPITNTIYIDNFVANRYLTTSSGESVSSTPNDYIQYRAILSTTDTAYFPILNNINLEYSGQSTVLSEDQIANVQPNRINLVSWANIGSGSLLYYGSRDGGTTWTQVDMTLQATESGDVQIYSGYADITSQPAGTDMKWKVVIGGEAQLHAMSMRWESGGGADLAEWYPTNDPTLKAAEVISADTTSSKSGYIRRTTKAYDPTVLGIISTAPGVQIGEMAENTKRVALAGRVPVLIASNSAAIKTGDFITSSNIPGKAMKAIKTGYTIGKALEDWDPNSGKDTVMTFVNLGTHINENDIGGIDKSSLEDIFGESGDVLGTSNESTPSAEASGSADLDIDNEATDSADISEASESAEASGSALLNPNTATDSATVVQESLTSRLRKIAQERLDAMFSFTGQEESEATSEAQLEEALNIVREDSIAKSQATLWEARDKFVAYGDTVGNTVGASTINAFNGLNAASATIYGRLVATSADIYGKLTAVSGEFIDLFAQRVETEELATDMISPIDPDGMIKFRLGENSDATGSGTLVIEDASGSAVTTIDSQGNITTLGDLIAKEVKTSTISADLATFVDASVSGELDATSARLEKLESKLAQIENLDAQTANIVNATVSGTLFADDISNFSEKVAAAIEEPSLLEKLMGANTNSVDDINAYFDNHDSFVTELDTTSASRLSVEDLTLTEEDLVIDATALYVDQYFDVNGSAFIAENLSVGQSLVLSDSMFITAGSIDYSPVGIDQPTLNIQPSGKGMLSLMAGLFTLDESGRAQVNGDFTVAGDLKVSETLLTNMISANDFTNPFQVQLATISGEVLGDNTEPDVKESRFEILNELGIPVATISAQGRADFSSGLGIGSERLEATDSAQIETKKTSGTATVKANSSEIVIKSPNVSEESLIYVTPMGSTGNKVLYVKEITNDNPETEELESYFKVGFDSNVDSDVRFNWWIVN